MKARSGFTLIEVIMAICIVSFLGGVIYSALSQGLKIWKRSSEERPELDMEIFSEKLMQDLGGTISMKSENLKGTSDGVDFYSASGPAYETPVEVRYYFDSRSNSFKKATRNYRSILNLAQNFDKEEKIASRIKNCKIQYYHYNEREDLYMWANMWQGPCAPLAVKVSVDFDDSVRTKKWMRIFPINSEICIAGT